MRRLPISIAVPLACLTAIAVPALLDGCTSRASSAALVFSAIPDQDETRLRAKFEPIAAYLSEQLQVPVEYRHATSYDDAVELFKNGDVQLAWFGGLSGVMARHAVPGATAIAQGAADPKFYSYFIAHETSGLEPGASFPDLRGKSFTFGSPKSTSGRLMPEHFLREHTGKSPSELLGREPQFTDSHDATVELVQTGQVQVGVVNYRVYDRRVQEGKTDPNVCRVVWRTPTYADYNFTAHPELETRFGAGFAARLQRALIEMTDPELLSAFPRDALIEATDDEFAAIEATARALGFVR